MVMNYLIKLFTNFNRVLIDVLLALIPVLVLIIVGQIFFLRYKKKRIINIIKGLIICVIGLILFLQGVQNGYYHLAQNMGKVLGQLEKIWLILPIGFLLGLSTTLADPAIYVLVEQAEMATSGAIKKKLLFVALCFGVALAVVISLVKLMTSISILWFIVPGYIVSILLSYYVEPDFSALAYDSGSVVTGTMIASFILPFVTGIAISLNKDPLVDALGIVGIVAMTPILTMLIFGALLKKKKKSK